MSKWRMGCEDVAGKPRKSEIAGVEGVQKRAEGCCACCFRRIWKVGLKDVKDRVERSG